jgi:hypothetical protein
MAAQNILSCLVPVSETLVKQIRNAEFRGWRLDAFRNVEG